jgi:PHS family inorganic phosphate transporter-like MFS transporter
MSAPGGAPGDPAYEALDDGKITRFQWKIMVVSGMGFFTDAYDLFVIGVVVALLKPEWNLSTSQVSLLNSATLAASAVGALVFGRVADILGRKKIYGYEVLILAIGAIASALAPNYTFLLVSRIILGIGIGGDYPVSATIMSEYSGKRSRGKMVGLVFAMQGAGLVVGPLVASVLLASHVPDDLIWRILLGLGRGWPSSICAAKSTRPPALPLRPATGRRPNGPSPPPRSPSSRSRPARRGRRHRSPPSPR